VPFRQAGEAAHQHHLRLQSNVPQDAGVHVTVLVAEPVAPPHGHVAGNSSEHADHFRSPIMMLRWRQTDTAELQFDFLQGSQVFQLLPRAGGAGPGFRTQKII
jgi:hypothetical protein